MGAVQDRRQHHRRPDRGGGQPADQAVQPHPDAQLPQVARRAAARARRSSRGRRRGRARRRARRCRRPPRAFDEQRVVEVAQAPAREASAHRQPGGALRPHDHAARDHGAGRADHQHAVDASSKSPWGGPPRPTVVCSTSTPSPPTSRPGTGSPGSFGCASPAAAAVAYIGRLRRFLECPRGVYTHVCAASWTS